MVWCGDCRGRIWRCLAGHRSGVQGWDLDQPMGASSSRQMDQPLGTSWPVDQSLGSPPGRMGKLVVSGAVELFAILRLAHAQLEERLPQQH